MADWLVVLFRNGSSRRRADVGGRTSLEEPMRCRIGVGDKPGNAAIDKLEFVKLLTGLHC